MEKCSRRGAAECPFRFGRGVKNTFDGGGPVYSESKTKTGWVAGGGIEYILSHNWTVGAEGLFIDLGSTSFGFGGFKTTRFKETGPPSAA